MASPAGPVCLTILLVEDEPDVRTITAAMARELGHTVFEAANAEDGLALLIKWPIDILIADVGLPGVTGEVFAAQARELRTNLGIVFATGSPDFANVPNDGTRTMVMRKPFDSTTLLHVLNAISAVRPTTGHCVKGT